MFDCSFTNYVAVGSSSTKITLVSDIAHVLSKECLDIWAITDCRFTLNTYVTR